jgi:hypothetical protein
MAICHYDVYLKTRVMQTIAYVCLMLYCYDLRRILLSFEEQIIIMFYYSLCCARIQLVSG